MDFKAEAATMRERAWEEVMLTEAFRAFRAADNMVVELGGLSVMPVLSATAVIEQTDQEESTPRVRSRTRNKDGSERPTQGEAAEAVLRELGPMGVKNLMDLASEKGAMIGGTLPLISFRSTLSKDKRFYSFRHNNDFLWWLTDTPLPESFDEAASDLLTDATSSHSSQEGEAEHAAAIT